MRLPLLDTALWAAGPLLNAALFCVICSSTTTPHLPGARLLVHFHHCSARLCSSCTYRIGSDHTYAIVYWIVEGT